MDVIICEDHLKQLEEITTAINNYAMMEDNGIRVALSTSNPEEVLAYAQTNKGDCYFLDVDLQHELTGITLGREIRKLDPLCQIVFITTHSEMTYLTFLYKVAAMDYIIKDDWELLRNRILETLKEAHIRYSQIGNNLSTDRLQLTISGRMRNIDHHSIYFFEASKNPHKLILHLHNEQIEFSGRLKDFENIAANFYRCHKSYIVNKNLIRTIDKKNRLITMTNGQTCAASSRLLKGLM